MVNYSLVLGNKSHLVIVYNSLCTVWFVITLLKILHLTSWKRLAHTFSHSPPQLVWPILSVFSVKPGIPISPSSFSHCFASLRLYSTYPEWFVSKKPHKIQLVNFNNLISFIEWVLSWVASHLHQCERERILKARQGGQKQNIGPKVMPLWGIGWGCVAVTSSSSGARMTPLRQMSHWCRPGGPGLPQRYCSPGEVGATLWWWGPV